MNKYYIKELKGEYSYLELRILTYLECEAKMKKITEILNFLAQNNFLTNFTRVYYYSVKAESFIETKDVPSLTIDIQNDKFRFKYWNGATTYWVYHTQDLFKILIQGREDFEKLVKKYEPVSNLLMANKDNNIKQIRYKYYPQSDVDILYELEFRKHVEDTQLTDSILKDIYNKIEDLKLTDLKMEIDYSFEQECLPCQKAKEAQQSGD